MEWLKVAGWVAIPVVLILIGVAWTAYDDKRKQQLDVMAKEKMASFDVEKERQEILSIAAAYMRKSPSRHEDSLLLPGRCPKCHGKLHITYVGGRGRRRGRRYIQCLRQPHCWYRIAYTRRRADDLLRD